MNQETSQQHPKVSISLRKPAALDWLDAISESNAILSAILAVIYPKLYNTGLGDYQAPEGSREMHGSTRRNPWAF